MRLFYAILFDKGFLDTLENNRVVLKSYGIGGRFVNKEKLHLTLKFLGEVDEDTLPKLKEINTSIQEISPFIIRLKGLGVFPPKGRPRVLWQGLEGKKKEDVENLERLKEFLENNMEELGFEKDNRKFKPHITLARDPKNVNRNTLNEIPVEQDELHVTSYSLMSSKLTRNGPIYDELCRYDLQDS